MEYIPLEIEEVSHSCNFFLYNSRRILRKEETENSTAACDDMKRFRNSIHIYYYLII